MSNTTTDSSTPPVVEDHELAARVANARLWWRRAITLSLIVLLACPITAATIWWLRSVTRIPIAYNPPGPDMQVLREMYLRYMREEGPNRRGVYFMSCAFVLWQQARAAPGGLGRTVSEEELLYHLGAPDETIHTSRGTDYVFRYEQAGSINPHIVTTVSVVNGRRVFTALDVRSGHKPTTQPRAPTSQ